MKKKILIICSEDGYKREQFRIELESKTKNIIKVLSGVDIIKSEKDQFYLPKNFNPFNYLYSAYKLKKRITEFKPDLIHVFDTRSSVNISLLKYLKLISIKSIRTQNGLGVFSKNSSFLSTIPATNFLKRTINFFISYPFECVVFQNRNDMRDCTNFFFLKLSKKEIIVGSGVSKGIVKLANTKNNLAENNYFLFASRILINKGILNFIDAAKLAKDIPHLSNFKWFIIGQFCDNDKNNKFIRKSIDETENVFHLGFKENPYPYLLNSRALILPSSYGEGFPRIILEAGMLKVPILATHSEYNEGILFDNKNSKLIKNGSSTNILRGIEYILDIKYKNQIVNYFYSEICKKYDLSIVIKKYINVYKNLM